MGEHYELVWFCGQPYIEFQSQQTEWKIEAVRLSQKKANQIETFQAKQGLEMQRFLKEMVSSNDQ